MATLTLDNRNAGTPNVTQGTPIGLLLALTYASNMSGGNFTNDNRSANQAFTNDTKSASTFNPDQRH
jgi:hypothetical protein